VRTGIYSGAGDEGGKGVGASGGAMTTGVPPSSVTSPTVGRWRGWLVAALALIAVVNFLDRAALGAVAPQIQAAFHLDTRGYQGIVNAFLLAFTLSYAFGGPLVDRFGPRRSLTASLILWSLAAMAQGAATTPNQLALCRALLGLGEGIFWPAALRASVEWFEPRDWGRPIGLATAGAGVGTALAPVVMIAVQSLLPLGWRGAFVLTGSLGLLLVPLWIAASAAPPRPGEDEEEETALAQAENAPVSAVVRTRTFATLMVAQAAATATASLLIFYLILFLERERGFSTGMVARVGWIPAACLDVGAVCGGLLARRLAERGGALVPARKAALFASAGLMPFFLIAYYIPPIMGIALLVPLCVACLGYGSVMTNLLTLYGDLFPRCRVGTMIGFGGAAGNLGAVLIGSVVAAAIDRTHSFLPMLLAAGLLPLLAAAIIGLGLRR
jgi:ACS family hexuronate transporter-like MFS transporter